MQNNTSTGLLGLYANHTGGKTHPGKVCVAVGCYCSKQDTVQEETTQLILNEPYKILGLQFKTYTATSLQTPPSNILAKQWELAATLKHNETKRYKH